VRCLPIEGVPGHPLRGWVTLVIVPHGTAPAPMPSAELVERVLAHVRARVPAGVAPRVRIVPPTYVPVAVQADVRLRRVEDVAGVEARVRSALAAFLHPLTGNQDGNGYAFGEPIYLSPFAQILEAIEGVDFIRRLQLEAGGALARDPVVVPAGALPTAGDHELTLGTGRC
jgi:hypothetical protein